MANSITLSVTIGSETTAEHASAEVDTRECGDNGKRLGKTQDFIAGDKVAVLVWLSPDVVIKDVYHTWNDIKGCTFTNSGQTSTYEHEKVVVFGNGVSQITLDKPCDGGIDYRWVGTIPKYKLRSTTAAIDAYTPKEGTIVPKVTLLNPLTIATDLTGLELKRKLGLCKVTYVSKPMIYYLTIPTQKEMEDALAGVGTFANKAPFQVDLLFFLQGCK